MPSIQKFPFHRLLFWKLIKNFAVYKKFGETAGIERMQRKPEDKSRDVYSYLMDARDPETGEGFSEPEIISESSLLILAGEQLKCILQGKDKKADIASRLRYNSHNLCRHDLLPLAQPRRDGESQGRSPLHVRRHRRDPSGQQARLMPLPSRLHRRSASHVASCRQPPPSRRPPRRHHDRRRPFPRRRRHRHPDLCSPSQRRIHLRPL